MHTHIGREEGQQIILVSLMLPILLVFVGLVIDVGNLYFHRRTAQNAADAAAVAGSIQLSIDAAAASDTALAYADSNGYSNSGSNTVTVEIEDGCVTVRITEQVRPLLVSLIWNGTFDVPAKAVACMMTVPLSSYVILFGKDEDDGKDDYTKKNTLYLNGTSMLRVPDGNIHVNSTSSAAVTIKGNPEIDTFEPVTLGCEDCLSDTDAFNHKPKFGVKRDNPDPLAVLPVPSTPPKSKCSDEEVTETKDLIPGIFCYTDGISLKSKDVLELPPGEYWIEGGIESKGKIIGNNVMLYIADDEGVDLSGCNKCVLSPLSSGPYSGVTIFGARNEKIDFNINGGKSQLDIRGIFYSAMGSLHLGGNAALSANFAVNTLELKGGSNLTVEGFTSTNWGTTEYRMTQ